MLSPALLQKVGRCGTRAFSTQTVLAQNPPLFKSSQARQGIFKTNHLSTVILSVAKNPVVDVGCKSWILRVAQNDGSGLM